ncbi:DUF4236 domain-containing protein [Bradyrhizobium sp. 193]|nr:DUF4236 domain-containing protein [Bradyrhizobium sp. 193]MCK1656649.1 DUF4236 domain-containing protein [Bradyrhizobium sp. 151]
MSFRFRRSFKIVPGVRLNLSGSGASVTLGSRACTTPSARAARERRSVCRDPGFRGAPTNHTPRLEPRRLPCRTSPIRRLLARSRSPRAR